MVDSYGSAQPQTRAASTVCHSQFCPLPACRDRRQILRDGKLIRAGLFSLRMSPEFGFMKGSERVGPRKLTKRDWQKGVVSVSRTAPFPDPFQESAANALSFSELQYVTGE